MKLFILLVVVVGIVAIAQLARVYELTARLRKTKEEDISYADNRLNAKLWLLFMVLFYAGFIVLLAKYGDYLPVSASAHGEGVDTLMDFNMYIIIAVFFVVNTLLFVFASKYYYRKDRKAKFFPHDNRLELFWTIVPSIVLAVIIIFGLRTWNEMTGEAGPDALRVEVYAKQFDWTVRYPGDNNEFGLANYNLISTTNPLGIVTAEDIAESLEAIESELAALKAEVENERGVLLSEKAEIEEELHPSHGHGHGDGHEMSAERKAHLEARLHEVEAALNSGNTTVLSEEAYEAKKDKISRLERHIQRIMEIEDFSYESNINAWDAGKDDRIVKGEFHLPVRKEVEFIFRSRDVIHSAYMPHFRAQMNCVPGVPTRFKMIPTITTDSMRLVMNNPEFDYILLCNKVCGAAHFNMAIKIVIDTPEQYEAWLKKQPEYVAKEETAPAVEPEAAESVEVVVADSQTAIVE
jgi:cytochrome c oxidase subunit II